MKNYTELSHTAERSMTFKVAGLKQLTIRALDLMVFIPILFLPHHHHQSWPSQLSSDCC